MKKTLLALFAGGLAVSLPPTVRAQTINSQVFETTIPFSYDRGRNESVLQRPRPDWDAIGVDIGGFTAFPTVTVSTGFTDNVYQATDAAKKSDGLVAVAPSLVVRSNWSVHSLKLDAGGNFVRYFNQASRNEDGYTVGAVGRIDISGDKALNIGARTSQVYESQFSSVGIPVVRSARPVQASLFNALADFRFARVRAVLAGDYSTYGYGDVQTFAGTTLNQRGRDRGIARGTAHLEYGLTPDAGAFIQIGYSDTDYRLPFIGGVANRDSNEIRALAGVSLDLTALIRGSLGVGYIDRRYDAPIYSDINGFSFDGKIEYFPTQLTTLTLILRRDIEDSAIPNTSGYFNTGFSLRADHELMRNVILNAGVDYENDSYRGRSASADIYRAAGGARYLLSRLLGLNANISYTRRDSESPLIGPTVDEVRGTIGVSIHR